MTVTLLKRLATLAALVCLAATLNTSAVGAQESRPGSDAELAGDQTPAQQINRLYGAVFDRTPDAGGFAFWVNELTSGARNLTQIADAMVGISPEFTDTYGNLDNRNFVNQLYLNVQDRPGETSGVDFWTGQLDTNTRTRGGVVLGFSESPEYRIATGSTDPLDRLYCAFFLRNPDPGGKTFWTGQYLTTERSLESIAQSFTGVTEFSNLYGSLSNRKFVELIYQNVLGRNLPLTEVGGPAFWTNELTTGARTRGQVMVEFSEAPEYQMRWTRNAPCPSSGQSVLTAVNDTATVGAAGSVVINWAENDTRPAGTTVAITTQPANGQVVVSGTTFTYTPTANTTATSDSFKYTLTSGGATAVATVSITILPVGTEDTAVDDRFVVFIDTPTALDVLTNDPEATNHTLSLTSATSTNGSISIAGQNIQYTPNTGYTVGRDGQQILVYDTFTYTLTNNANGDTSTATVEVAVLAEPNCEVFMNYPFGSTNGVGGDDTKMELFFSSESCVEVYDQTATFDVNWSSVTIDGAAVTTTSGVGPLQEFITITPAHIADDSVTVAGVGVLTVNGTDSVSINFGLEFTTADGGTTWARNVASYSGREGDATVLVNPLP